VTSNGKDDPSLAQKGIKIINKQIRE